MPQRGTVSSFNPQARRGFIRPATGGAEVSVRSTALKLGLKTIEAGQVVEFEIAQGANGPEAAAVVVIPHEQNPYNFAEWHGDQPWMMPLDEGDTHERWQPGRFSGTFMLTLEARTQVFVPAGTLTRTDEAAAPGKTQGNPQRFWRCVHPCGHERFGIPGSTVKGAVRTLFETWTNSRLGFLTEEHYQDAIPYRRRSARAWVISVNPDGSRAAVTCDLHFAKGEPGARQFLNQQGNWVPWTAQEPIERQDADGISLESRDRDRWQSLPSRANLWWSPEHKHLYEFFFVRVEPNAPSLAIPAALVSAYRRNLNHPSFNDHADRVQDIVQAQAAAAAAPGGTRGVLGENWYKDIEAEAGQRDQRLADLARLNTGDVIFGIKDPANPAKLKCFGKNVNFLWPSDKRPEDLMGHRGSPDVRPAFWPRSLKECDLASADPAESAFGFAGTYASSSHPFRGRIRFGTFWAADSAQDMPAVRVGPLMSPPGVKLKARPLYLPPPPAGSDCADYDSATRLRGRKFYWHQPRAVTYGAGQPGEIAVVWICPLPAKTVFEGAVHFENLTLEELGALLTVVEPRRFFGAEHVKDEWGIKIGKAKPRGYGSLATTVSALKRLGTPRDAYSAMKADALVPDAALVDRAVAAFRAWLLEPEQGGGGTYRDTRTGVELPDLPFVRDLAALLRLPGSEKQYQANPQLYGWMPAFNDARGNPNPNHGKPRAMPKARDVDR